jgi:hypothetical protein
MTNGYTMRSVYARKNLVVKCNNQITFTASVVSDRPEGYDPAGCATMARIERHGLRLNPDLFASPTL